MFSRVCRVTNLFALLVCLGSSHGVFASAFCDRLIVTGNPEYPPFLWRDKENPDKLTGAAIELLQKALAEKGIELDARYVGPWSRAQAEARMGRVDMLAGAFITDERQTYMAYVKPQMMDMPNVIFTKKGENFVLKSWDDLIGRLGDTLINNSFGQEFDRFAKEKLTIEEVRSIEFAFERLLLGRTDYVIYELFQGYAISEVRGFKDQIEHLDMPISSEGLYFTVSLKSECYSPEFVQYLNDQLESLVKDGVPDEAAKRGMSLWFEQATHLDG